MEFRILGPLEVRGEHGPLAVGGAKPRAVLAMLLLNANEPVSVERLAVGLWGEDAPVHAGKTVQMHVSRLRKALGDPDVVATTAAGYQVRVRRGELDVERFAGEVRAARAALDAGEPERAAVAAQAALALWRGPALADLAFERFAQPEIGRLEEERLAAVELRVEAELAQGRHAAVLGELQQLATEHPTREGLACLRMLALYRSGRQADALDAFRALRSVLVAEVGVEPGPDARRLHDAILRQDPSLDPAAPEPAPLAANGRRDEVVVCPFKGLAPFDVRDAPVFFGRDRLVSELVTRLAGAQFLAVVGASGTGKS